MERPDGRQPELHEQATRAEIAAFSGTLSVCGMVACESIRLAPASTLLTGLTIFVCAYTFGRSEDLE